MTTFKKITSFSFLKDLNSTLDIDVHAKIEDNVYELILPLPIEMGFTNLIASFNFIADTISINGIPQTSGISENDFLIPVTYTLTAEDGSTQEYIIKVVHNNLQNVVPQIFSLRLKQLFDVLEEHYRNSSSDAIDIIRNLYNPEFDLPIEVVEKLLDLFGFYIGDLSYFDDETQKKLNNLFLNNIFTIYRKKLKEDVFLQIFYIYGLTGNVYPLNTYDWQSFFRSSTDYSQTIQLFTDSDLTTDMDIETDNIFRTPFVEIEILLEKSFSNGTLWFDNIDSNIKNNFDNLRHVLSKLFFTLKATAVGISFQTIPNDNGMIVYADDIPGIEWVNIYKFYYTDGTSEEFVINEKNETSGIFNFIIRFIDLSKDVIIEKIELSDNSGRVYIEVNSPEIFIKSGDTFYFIVSVVSQINEVENTYSYNLYSEGYYS